MQMPKHNYLAVHSIAQLTREAQRMKAGEIEVPDTVILCPRRAELPVVAISTLRRAVTRYPFLVQCRLTVANCKMVTHWAMPKTQQDALDLAEDIRYLRAIGVKLPEDQRFYPQLSFFCDTPLVGQLHCSVRHRSGISGVYPQPIIATIHGLPYTIDIVSLRRSVSLLGRKFQLLHYSPEVYAYSMFNGTELSTQLTPGRKIGPETNIARDWMLIR